MEIKDFGTLEKGLSTAVKIVVAKITDKGNGTFRTKKGTHRYFVPQAVLESAGIKALADITFPLYCYAKVEEITPRNPNAVADEKNPGKFKDIVTDKECKEFLDEKVLRPEITVIYKTKAEFFGDSADDDLEGAEYATFLRERGKAAGLDDELVNTIANQSVVQL